MRRGYASGCFKHGYSPARECPKCHPKPAPESAGAHEPVGVVQYDEINGYHMQALVPWDLLLGSYLYAQPQPITSEQIAALEKACGLLFGLGRVQDAKVVRDMIPKIERGEKS